VRHFASGLAALLLAGCYGGDTRAGGNGGPAMLAGAPAVSYDVKRTDGRPDALANYRGSIVVMNLWATWCPPCREEIPDLVRFAQRYRSRGVVVLGVDEGESSRVAAAFARERGVRYPILLDEKQQYGGSYAAIGLPTTVVIDRSGKIVHGYDGPLTSAQMEAAVAPVLAQR